MNKIRILDKHTINKIAAGEVIENPSSVIKELVENSLDAHSSLITIEIQAGGRQLIRISDNGHGMSSEDAKLCFERHATSKIAEVEDIESIATKGFRGEALPSIASISKLTVLTNQTDSLSEAIFLKIEGGELLHEGQGARSQGTTFEVKELFFNVPVRRKFQKSPSADTQLIYKVVSLLALSHPTVQFELIADGKPLLKTPLITLNQSQENFSNRIESVLGRAFLSELSVVELQEEGYQLVGFLSRPSYHKLNRTQQYLFINERAVSSSLVSNAIREGYGPMLPSKRYPSFVLYLTIPGSLVDVNVHPQKKEVRIREERKLKELLYKAVQKAFTLNDTTDFKQEIAACPAFFSMNRSPPQEEKEWTYEPQLSSHFLPKSQESSTFLDTPPSFFAPPIISQQQQFEDLLPEPLFTFKGYIVVDRVHNKFIDLRQGKEDGLCLLSQKNAYARLLYEQLHNRLGEPFSIQTLLLPLTERFSSLEFSLLQRYLPFFQELGFSLREFGEYTFILEAYPSFLEEKDLLTHLHQTLNELHQEEDLRKCKQLQEEYFADIACRTTCKSSKKLSLPEAKLLIEQLFSCHHPFESPKGNKIFAFISANELSKLF